LDVVSSVALTGQALRCLPELRRAISEDPVGDDLMDAQVKLCVDGFPAHVDFGRALLDRPPEAGVLGGDQEATVVLVFRVEKGDIDVIEDVMARAE